MLLPRTRSLGAEDRIARADGLTEDEAHMLTTWLRASGYAAIEVLRQEEHVSVLWSK